MIRQEIRPLPTFEEDYDRFVFRREQVEEEVRQEYEKVLKERTEKLDRIIAELSEIVEIEVPDEVQEPEQEAQEDPHTQYVDNY